jgi:Tol biopolymer transport system component
VDSFTWAPKNSSLIAYTADQDTVGVRELYVSKSDGTSNIKVSGSLVTGGNVASYSWSPKASQIAYSADQVTDNVVELYASKPDASQNAKISGASVGGPGVTSYELK